MSSGQRDPRRAGIVSYGVYLPAHRLPLAALPGGRATGSRTVAGFDEDATTMAVAAGRTALRDGPHPEAIYFATTAPPYVDKTNATAVRAAVGLGHRGAAFDLAGSWRSATAALRGAADRDGLAVLADQRIGRPGSADERDGGDGAAAFLFGTEEPIAELLAEASSSAEFLDRWRVPGEFASSVWEERFGADAYAPLVADAVSRALAEAGVEQPDHTVVSSPQLRAARAGARAHPGRQEAPPLRCGQVGAADAGIRLADALDRARPGETILLAIVADGCDALVFRATEALAAARPRPVAEMLDCGIEIDYTTYLTWRGLIEREPPRRPEPERPAAPPTARSESWKFGLVGSRCDRCDLVHMPPRRICARCGAVDESTPVSLADRTGTVANFTVDRLAFSPSPPLIDAVIDFDGGGRCTLEVTDAGPGQVKVGTQVAPTFRRLYSADGVHNYFWKAMPVSTGEGGV
jgi:3-hydroxy-3-methylglutaryl CoA synthase